MGFKVKYNWEEIVPNYLKERDLNNISVRDYAKQQGFNYSSLYREVQKRDIVLEKSVEELERLDNIEILHASVDIFRFDGALLGDGCISNSSRSIKYRYSQASKHLGHLEWLSSILPFFYDKLITERTWFDKRTNKEYNAFHQHSLSSTFLQGQRVRWYPSGIKIIPYDLNLNNDTLLHYYLDDGSLGSKGGLMLAADDFSFEQAEILKRRIEDFTNLKLSTYTNGNKDNRRPRLYISKPQAKDFLSVIGDCPVPCLAYKWQPK